MSYAKTVWVNDAAPAINATNLNKIEQGIYDAHVALDAIPTGLCKITRSSFAGGPPGSPSDGDMWIATGVTANGIRWMFQYNAGSSSPYKWEFIGGGKAVSTITTSETVAATSQWVDLATVGPTHTLVRSGDYAVEGFTRIIQGGAAASTSYFGAKAPTAVNPGGNQAGAQVATSNTADISFESDPAFDGVWGGLAAGGVIKLQYYATSTLIAFGSRMLRVRPIRVS